MIGNQRGRLVMPRITGKEINMSVTGTSALNQRRPEKDKEKLPAKVSINRGWPKDEVVTQDNVIQKYLADKPRVKLPALATNSRLTNEEKYDLQALLRVRCFDYSLQVRQLIPEWTRQRSNTKSSTSSSSYVQRFDPFSGGRGIPRKRLPFVIYDQNYEEGDVPHKDYLKVESKVSPLSSSVLEGQRVNLREKYKIEANSENDFVNRHIKRRGLGKLYH